MLDLVLPLECGGLRRAVDEMVRRVRAPTGRQGDEPHLITPRVDPGVPVLSLGRYAGARREAIVAVKEHGRADLIAPLAIALRAGLECLLTWGVVATPLTIVPAPTRRSAARRRGGDPVTRMARAATAGLRDVRVDVEAIQALRLRALVRDSVGLSIADRQRNIAGRVKIGKHIEARAQDVLVVDGIRYTRRHRQRIGPCPTNRRCSRGRCPCDCERLTAETITPRSTRCEELKTCPRIYWHDQVNTDYRRHQPPVNASRRRTTRSASIAEQR